MTKAGLEPLKASTGVAVACAVIGAAVVVGNDATWFELKLLRFALREREREREIR